MRRNLAIGSALLGLSLVTGAVVVVAQTDSSPAAAPLTAAAPAVAQAPDLNSPEVVASGLEVPWAVAFLPDDSVLVTERRSGRLQRIPAGGEPELVVDIADVADSGEGGLMGIALSPTFAEDNLVYVYYTTSTDNRLVRFPLDNPQNREVILDGVPRNVYHNGGRIKFGPDGMLYVTTGDAGQRDLAQDQQSLAGKILRMTPDGQAPADNPFPGSLVYSMGHRNVQGIAWDADGRLYASEFGEVTTDEINLIEAGANYGWPAVEGIGTNNEFRNPIVTWSTREAGPSGITVIDNSLYVGSVAGTRLWVVPLDGNGGAGTPTAQFQGTYGRIRFAEAAPDGSLWIGTSNRDGRGRPAADDDRVIRFPAA